MRTGWILLGGCLWLAAAGESIPQSLSPAEEEAFRQFLSTPAGSKVALNLRALNELNDHLEQALQGLLEAQGQGRLRQWKESYLLRHPGAAQAEGELDAVLALGWQTWVNADLVSLPPQGLKEWIFQVFRFSLEPPAGRAGLRTELREKAVDTARMCLCLEALLRHTDLPLSLVRLHLEHFQAGKTPSQPENAARGTGWKLLREAAEKQPR